MPEFNYDEDTAIDPDELFEEWVKFSSVFFQYSKHLVTLEKDVKVKWEKTKTTRAELVRESGGKNEAEREAYFRPHPDYLSAKQAQTDAEYERDMVQAVISALYRKEKGLEGALAMAKMEWWRGPKELTDVLGGKRIMDTIKDKKANERRAATSNSRTRKRT